VKKEDNDLHILEKLLEDDISIDKKLIGKENFEKIYTEYLNEKYFKTDIDKEY